jgi:hypothetical protein
MFQEIRELPGRKCGIRYDGFEPPGHTYFQRSANNADIIPEVNCFGLLFQIKI